jgi:mannose-6-phosphate isomerase
MLATSQEDAMNLTSTPEARPAPSLGEQRPWGSWEVLDVGPGYKVKRLSVDPHARLSLQTHQHRSEHWLVVTGVATCTVGGRVGDVVAGGHVFVPRGAVHRIANDADDLLLIVEVQLGHYLEEDDIVRLEDDHGRA